MATYHGRPGRPTAPAATPAPSRPAVDLGSTVGGGTPPPPTSSGPGIGNDPGNSQPNDTTIQPTTGGGGSATGVTPGQAAAPTNSLSDATITALIRRILAEYGFEGQTALASFLRDLINQGVTNESLLLTYLEQRPEWQSRFPGMEERRQQGFDRITARQYVDMENYVSTLFQTAGLPPGFYDQRSDFTRFITSYNDLGQGRRDIQQRVEAAFGVVAAGPPEVRDAFASYFGAQGDAALAAYVLDPDRALPALQQQVQVAQVGGAGRQFGFDTDRELSQELVDRGIGQSQALSGFATVAEFRPVFRETISEDDDYTAEKEGIESVFRLDQNSTDRLARRLEQRRANFAGNAGFLAGRGALTGLRVGR